MRTYFVDLDICFELEDDKNINDYLEEFLLSNMDVTSYDISDVDEVK